MNIVSDKLLSDLEINNKVIPQIDHTITNYGKMKFRELFKIMYHEKPNLMRRRQIIESIMKHPKNANKISKLLKKIKKKEKSITWFFSSPQKEYKDLYFKKDYFNSSDLLSAKNFLKIYMPSIVIIVYLFIYMVLRYYGVSIDIMTYLQSIYESYKMFIMGALYLFMENINMISLLTNLFATLYVLYQVYAMYSSFDSSYSHYNKCCDFDKHIVNIQDVLNYSVEIYKLDKFLIHEKKLLKGTFDEINEEFSDVSKFGEKLLLKKNHHEYENKINSVLQYVGLIDSFINIGNLVKYHGYTFPNFDFDKKSPYVNANGLWSPYMDYFQQVKNNCALGNPNNVILTGPNTSGKSCFIRNTMLSIFLSQTIGITCCNNLQFTPFNHLFTYLDIPNISRDKESLFEAEILRCMEYCKVLENLKENEYVFSIMDELFTGTNPKEGIASSYSVCEYMSNFKNSLNIITTHFMQLTDLEKEYPDKFKNMKFYVIKSDNGFIRPYTIENGKSEQHIAIELLHNKGYNNVIIERALDKLKEL